MIEDKLKAGTLAERHKNLNRIVLATTLEEFTPEYITKLSNEKSQLNQIYLVEVANRLKNPTVICELLKSEDGLIASKALKCKWFFNKATNRDIVKVDYFMENIFPFVSYSTKCKIITNLSIHINDCDTAELFYKTLLTSHGRSFTIKLLTACSEVFIKENMKIPDEDISDLQIKYLYKKYPQLIINYIKSCLESKHRCDDLLLMIFYDHADFFKKMYNEHFENITVKFSYKMTYFLLKNDRGFVMKHGLKIAKKGNVEAIFKLLKGDSRDEFILKLFSANRKEYPFIPVRFTDKMQPEYAAIYFMKLYEKMYNESGLLNTMISLKIIKNLPLEMRKVWIGNKMSVKNDESKYLKYLSTDVAIEKLKILNRSASTEYERKPLLVSMIDCCKINKDYNALLDVLKYVAQRHRNDSEELCYNFLFHLQSVFELHKLSEDHWIVIDEMLTIMYLNKEIEQYFRYQFLGSILEQRIHYNLNNNLEIESIIDTMMEYNLNKFNMLVNVSDYEERIIDIVFEKYKPLIVDQEMDTKVEAKIILLLDTYKKWNLEHSDKPKSVTDCDWLMMAIRKWLVSFDVLHKRKSSMVRFLWDDVKARQVFFVKLYELNCNKTSVKNMLIHNIDIVLNNIDLFLENSTYSYSIGGYRYIYYTIQAYINKPFGKKIKEKLLQQIENPADRSMDSLAGVITALSFLLNAEDFESILKKYTSDITKIKFEKSTPNIDKKDYQKMKMVLEKLKYINPPISYGIIQNYAKDDFLKFVIPSMLSMCFKKNIKDTYDYMNRISRKNIPVSLKKHSIRMFYFLYPKDKLASVYREIWNGEKNSSMRDVIFEKTFETMLVNKGECVIFQDMWQLIKHFLNSFTEEDKNLFPYFISRNIDDSIFSEYCETVWSILKRVHAGNKYNVDDIMMIFIDNLTFRLELLDENFCDSIVNEYLLSINYTEENESTLSNSLLNFCVSYVVKVKTVEIQTKRVNKMCCILKKYIAQYWDRSDDNYVSRNSIHTFVVGFCDEIVQKINLCPLPTLLSITDLLTTALPREAIFEVYLYLKLTILFVEARNRENLKNDIFFLHLPDILVLFKKFSELFAEYFKTIINTYGFMICPLFHPIFNRFVSHTFWNMRLPDSTLLLYLLRELLYVDSKNTEFLGLILELLPISQPSLDGSDLIIFKEIIQLLTSSDNVVIKMIVNKKFGILSNDFIRDVELLKKTHDSDSNSDSDSNFDSDSDSKNLILSNTFANS